MGTSTVAASSVGVSSRGIELNPYSALAARARASRQFDMKQVFSLLNETLSSRSTTSFPSAFVSSTGTGLSARLRTLLTKQLCCKSSDLIQAICLDQTAKADVCAISLVSLLAAIRSSAKVERRSNPAWLLPETDGTEDANPDELVRSALDVALAIAQDTPHTCSANVEIYIGSFTNAPVRRGAISRFITSPPYLNRLDYVNTTLPELQGMGITDVTTLEALRSEMMGTTKMRKLAPPESFNRTLPPVARAFLETVYNHHSKAASTYYYNFYRQYMIDTMSFFNWLGAKCSATAKGYIVIQDSYFKEIRVPITAIYADIARKHGFLLNVSQEETRFNHMGAMNPHQRRHAPEKSLTEFILEVTRER